jgi:hypothetical protein
MDDAGAAVDTQQVGEVAVWAIKDFSIEIRKHVTDQARRQGCTVADWLHAYFHKHGVDGAEINPVKITKVEPLSRAAPSVDEACRLADSVARLAEAAGDRKPRGAIMAAARLLRQEMGVRTAVPAPGARKALPAPVDA